MPTVTVPERVHALEYYEETAIAYTNFTDGGAAVGTYQVRFTLPVGFMVMFSAINNLTGFAGDVSATITVGDGSDVDRYNTGTPSVFATLGGLYLGVASGTAVLATANRPTLTVTVNADWGNVSAGQLDIRIYGYQL